MTLDKHSLPIPTVPTGKEKKVHIAADKRFSAKGMEQYRTNELAGKNYATEYAGWSPEEIFFWQAIRNCLVLLTNQKGHLGKAAVLWEDLQSLNLVQEETDGAGNPIYSASSPEEIEEILDLDPPPTPTGLSLTTSINAITLSWGGYDLIDSNMAYVSVYRNTVDDVSTATAIGTASGYGYIDKTVQNGNTYYYWIRGNSISGVQGLYNSTNGTSTYLELTPTSMINELAKQVSAGGAEVWKFGKNTFAIETLSGDYPFIIETVTISGVPTSKIALAGSTWIADAHIETAKFADLDVEEGKFASLSAVTAKFDDASVATVKIEDAAIETVKIRDAAVETLKIGEQEVTLTSIYEFHPLDYHYPGNVGGWALNGNLATPIVGNLDASNIADDGVGYWSDYYTILRLPYTTSNTGPVFIEFPLISIGVSGCQQGDYHWTVPEISVWLGGTMVFSKESDYSQIAGTTSIPGNKRNDPDTEYNIFSSHSPDFAMPAILPSFINLGIQDNSADPYIYVKVRLLCSTLGYPYQMGSHVMRETYEGTASRQGAGTYGYNPVDNGVTPPGQLFSPGYGGLSYNVQTWNGYQTPQYGKIPLIRVFEAKR